jgi:hypothetical protein
VKAVSTKTDHSRPTPHIAFPNHLSCHMIMSPILED